MGKFSKITKKEIEKEHRAEEVVNHMGGVSYKLSNLETLKIVASSSIFAEPSFYRESSVSNYKKSNKLVRNVLPLEYLKESTENIFIKTVNKALDTNFKEVLDYAIYLRNELYMRLNPSVIFVLAMQHDNRVEFNKDNPGYMAQIGKSIINIPTDVINMFEFYLLKNETKKKMPSALKRVMERALSNFSEYHISKYKSSSLIDVIRVSHASSKAINELISTGTVKVKDSSKTWEQLSSAGKNWNEIIETIRIPHMALLRNLRNIVQDETISFKNMKKLMSQLVDGVENGKQFPFRYYTAYNLIDEATFDKKLKKLILSTLEDCIDKAMENFPKLKGKTMSLVDNSGSAHGTFASQYGSVKVSDIANLSGIMTAINSDEGYVGVFGDQLKIQKIKDSKGVLKQHKKLDTNVGMATENGIWIFLKNAIENKEHWDNIFIYSDMQAGHGGLYGLDPEEYKDYSTGYRHIDVLKLVDTYRKTVNPKVNVFSVQVGGYNNSILPENIYRGAVLSGWTGKEVLFAQEIINTWDKKEKSNM